MTAIEVFQQAVERGLKLGVEPGETLTVQPAAKCSPDFARALKARKGALLPLLRLPFVIVESKALGDEIVFFAADDDIKTKLVEAGADPWSIYTKAELRQLVQQNRIAPISSAELRKLHEIRRTFHGRIPS